jgi:polysaccharide export outer membrane protein
MRYSTTFGVLLLVFLAAGAVVAQEYVIGPGDVLQVNFWQDPSLNTTVRVGQDGYISVDIIGRIEAASKTPLQLQDDIVRRMSRLNKRISQAVVRVTEYNYRHVFVTGQVNNPGKLTFEQIPDLVTILNEAGWITPQGDLSRVTLIRGGEEAGEVEVVDVAAAIASGRDGTLPEIRRGDAIEVPMTPAGVPSQDLAVRAERRNVLYVTGAVNTPGPIRYEENLDVYEAIAMAGGPTDAAELDDVRVLSKDMQYAQAYIIDLKEYSRTGSPARYTLRQEDHVVVPARRSGFLESTIGTVATALGVVTSAVLLYQALDPDETTGRD